jgi:hypothetical protein
MPAKGNEKPVVENRVKTLQRRWSTPVPRAKDLQELNGYLRECCIQEQSRTSSKQTETIGERLKQDKQNATPLPKYRFDTCIRKTVTVCKYQFAQFDSIKYSVPRHCAFQNVILKGYVDRIEIVMKDSVVAQHTRSYEPGTQILDPLHYLNTLKQRPGALDQSNVYRNWKLPACFEDLRKRLENKHGSFPGVKQYVRVLQLLADHKVKRVQQAIEQLRDHQGADADKIIRRVEQSAEYARKHASDQNLSEMSYRNLTHDELTRPELLSVQVPTPSLSHYDQLLSNPKGGKDADNQKDSTQENRCQLDVAEKQSQTIETSDDECGVREASTRSIQYESDLPTVSSATVGNGSRSTQQQ